MSAPGGAADLLPLVEGLAAGVADLRARIAALARQDGLPSGVGADGGAGVPAGTPGPVVSGPAGVPAGGRPGAPLAGAKPSGARSGLPWASAWRHASSYTANVKPAFESFEAYRGRKLDGLHVFVQGWKGRPLEQWPANSWTTGRGATPGGSGEGVLRWLGRDRIPAFLTWPLLSDTGVPAGKGRFRAVVDGAYDASHAAVADLVLATGAPVATIRLGHEANMAAAYPWGLDFAEGDLPLFRAAYARVAGLLQARFPAALLDFNCLRQLRGVAGLDDIFPGPPFRIISGEGYGTDDTIATPEGLARFMAQGTPDLPMGPESWAAAAAKRGCLYAVPEWSTAVPPGREAVRDSADYVRAMFGHFSRLAPLLAYEAQFPTDNPGGTGLHSFWDPISSPRASAAYRDCWGAP